MRARASDPVDQERLGRVLRTFREERVAWTQQELAAEAGVTKNYLADVERGVRNPTFLVLQRILDALELSWEEFGRAVDRASASKTEGPAKRQRGRPRRER